MRREGIGALRDLVQHVHRALVEQRVHGIQAQPVDVVVAHPHERVLDDVGAHGVLVEIDRVAPRVAAALAQVRPELRQVVARGSEVVVDDVLHDREPRRVGGIHEPLVGGGTAVRFVHGVPEHAVIAPVPDAVEAVDRQQLDVGHAEVDEVVEASDRGIQGALGGEGAEVQFVDEAAGELPPRPGGIRPGEGRRVEPLGCLVHTRGLPPRARVGAQVVAVTEDEAVAFAVGEDDGGGPPSAGQRLHLDVIDDGVAAVVEPAQSHPLHLRRPDVDAHVVVPYA